MEHTLAASPTCYQGPEQEGVAARVAHLPPLERLPVRHEAQVQPACAAYPPDDGLQCEVDRGRSPPKSGPEQQQIMQGAEPQG